MLRYMKLEIAGFLMLAASVGMGCLFNSFNAVVLAFISLLIIGIFLTRR